MGKSSGSAPAAPDPAATSAAQAAANADTARLTARMNRVNENTPLGSRTYTDLGNDRWQSDISLSPNQQRLFSGQEGIDLGLQGLAAGQIPRVQNALNTPISFDGLPDPMAQGGNIAASADRVAQDIYTRGVERLQPDFNRVRQTNWQNLADRGIGVGNEAFTTESNRVDQGQTDALRDLALGSEQYRGAEQSRLTNLANSLRQQGIQERSLVRDQPLRDVAALLGTGSGPQMPQFGQTANTSVAPTDVVGPIQNNYNAQMQQWQQGQQNSNSLMGGLFSLGAAGLRYGLPMLTGSDRRIKEGIKRVGEMTDGTPVYTFRYRNGDGVTHMGVMAQELMVTRPDAVHDVGGVLHVDYGVL